MKKLQLRAWGSVGLLTLTGLLTSCANNEPAMQEEIAATPKTSTTSTEAKKIAVEVIKPQQELSEAEPVVEQKLASETLIPAPLGGDDFMDAAHQVDPWLANYVGSYGLLPTRFQDKGPFLYSFDVEPDSDD